MLLLQPFLDQRPLGTGIDAYATGGTVLVPLGELCRLLAFGIVVDPGGHSASGFFISPKRTFRLDLDLDSVQVEGRRLHLPRVIWMEQDLYVDARSLADWFPLDVKVDLKGAVLTLKAKEPLPIQGIWERDGRFGNQSMSRYQDGPGTELAPQHVAYSFMDMPFIDLALGADLNTPPTTAPMNGSAELSGDLLWMSSDLFANRANGSWIGSRATLFREDPQGGLLGPMHAKRISAGDLLNTPVMDLVGSLPEGRGLSTDNDPLAYRSRFATRTFRGPLREGWSVEFFQNGGLVGFQPSRPDGLYEFKDVPLRFGINLFRLVYHGPLGEQREEQLRLDITQDQPAPGAFMYNLSGLQPRADELSIAPATLVQANALQSTAYLSRAEYGLSTAWSVQGGLAGMALLDGYHNYQMMGLRSVTSFLAVQLTAAQDQGPSRVPGAAAQLQLSTGNASSPVTLHRQQFRDGFERSIYDNATLGAIGYTVKAANGLDANWSTEFHQVPLSLSAQVDEEDYLGGTRGLRKRILLSTRTQAINFSNTIATLSLPGQAATFQGVLTATSFQQAWSWQGTLNYDQSRLTGWGFQEQYHGIRGYQYLAGITAPVGSTEASNSPGSTQVFAGVQRLTGRWGFGANVARSGAAYSANLQLQVSLGREPRSHHWTSDAQPITATGAVSVLAFQDSNGNGVRDPGEAIIEGAKFKVGGAPAVSQVQDPAVTFVNKLARAQPVEISLDEASLQDSSQKAAVKTLSVVPRPGKVVCLEFPVVLVGELNGTTRIRRDGKLVALPGLEVAILDHTGHRVRVARSAYDGFFEFRDLPYGEYLLSVTPEEIARVRLKPAEPRRVQLQASQAFLDGMDLVVESLLPERNGP